MQLGNMKPRMGLVPAAYAGGGMLLAIGMIATGSTAAGVIGNTDQK